MADKRVKLIINPNADMGHAWRQTSEMRPVAERYGGVDWAGTVYPTHAVELAKQAAEDGYDVVVAVGGDGTVHEVVNGLMQIPANKRPQLGVVPLGSGNDFAHVLGMHEKPERALQEIFKAKPRKIDVASIEDEHGRKEFWNNTINIGFGGSVNIYSHSLPVVRGFLMYFVAVVLTIMRHYDVIEMTIKTDGKEWQQDVMMMAVCNGPREGGGFQTAPDAILDDGLLNFTAVKKMSRAMMFRLIPEFMGGTHGKFKQISMGTLKEMEMKSPQPLILHLDGETYAGFASDVHHLKIKLLAGALEVLAPSP
jgi:YegS/Rv2252/BmrU family lipid kinase